MRNKEVPGRKEIIDIYASTGTLILYHCCLNSNKLKQQMFLFYASKLFFYPLHSFLPLSNIYSTLISFFSQELIFPALHPIPSSPTIFLKTHFSHFFSTCHIIHLMHQTSPIHLVNSYRYSFRLSSNVTCL